MTEPAPVVIRAARLDELEQLRRIEIDGGRAYAEVGMVSVARDPPSTAAELARYVRAGRAWVAVDDSDAPLGYLILRIIDDCGHIEQVSVLSSHKRRGIGTSLIERAAEYASGEGLLALTLTTFRDVAWNAPYYEALGFEATGPARHGPELSRLIEHERAQVPSRAPRVAMRRALSG